MWRVRCGVLAWRYVAVHQRVLFNDDSDASDDSDARFARLS